MKARVIIRPPTMDDCDAFVAAVKRSRALHHPWVLSKATTRAEYANYLKRFSGDANHGFLIVHRETNALVGMINVNNVVRGAFQNGALGYYAFAPLAGQGLMTEGMLLVLRHAFTKLKLHRLEANIQPGNCASIALARRCGFVCEGVSKRMLKLGGQWRDHERWVILSEDFRRGKLRR